MKTLATNKETTIDLQTCKIIDSAVERTMRPSWSCYQLSFNNQIWCRDSFQEGSNITFQRRGGGNPPFLRHRTPKESS